MSMAKGVGGGCALCGIPPTCSLSFCPMWHPAVPHVASGCAPCGIPPTVGEGGGGGCGIPPTGSEDVGGGWALCGIPPTKGEDISGGCALCGLPPTGPLRHLCRILVHLAIEGRKHSYD